MQAAARLWLLAALPALTGQWVALGEVVSASEGVAAVTGGVGGGGPAFAARQQTSVVAARGQDAVLDCRVLRQGDKAVSWVRSRDLQILSHAGAVFTADARVSTAETRAAGRQAGGSLSSHALHLARLRASDAGRYECQVNTDPKLSLFFNLTVLDEEVPRVVVSVQGARVVSGAAGGAVELACEARYEPAPRALPVPPLALVWRRLSPHPQPLQSRPGGVSLETERWGAARVVSRVTLAGLRGDDAGRYECAAAGHADTLTLRVHAGEGGAEGAEAMQRDQSAPSAGDPPPPPPRSCWGTSLLALAALLNR